MQTDRENLPMIRNTERSTTSFLEDAGIDIVKLNLGGKVFLEVLRNTLCQAPSDALFTRIFSKEQEVKQSDHLSPVTVHYDDEGRIFLDHDPELMEIIINFMRSKQIEDPSDPIVEPPVVPSPKSKDFRRLLNYFGLTAFFFYPNPQTTARIARAVRSMSIEEEQSPQKSFVHNLMDDTVSIDASHNSAESNSVSNTDMGSNCHLGEDYCYG